tara:strand:+ start:1384 stop:1890 length:507 start_codon:yes stop_codon:yes gene_type:complete
MANEENIIKDELGVMSDRPWWEKKKPTPSPYGKYNYPEGDVFEGFDKGHWTYGNKNWISESRPQGTGDTPFDPKIDTYINIVYNNHKVGGVTYGQALDSLYGSMHELGYLDPGDFKRTHLGGAVQRWRINTNPEKEWMFLKNEGKKLIEMLGGSIQGKTGRTTRFYRK